MTAKTKMLLAPSATQVITGTFTGTAKCKNKMASTLCGALAKP